jgi:muramoyltetrapeptide carboxypeptidase
VVTDRLGGLGVPVLYGFPFGHTTRPNPTLPLGVRATLDATRRTLTLEEPAVV